jgi:hypothetical protein
MTQPSDDAPPPERPRLTWRCTICKRLLVLRPTTENEEAFRARCAAHANAARVCRAKLLVKQLEADGFTPLRTANGTDFVAGYAALKDAGLVTRYLTHVNHDYVTSTPWSPGWAAEYEDYLRRTRNLSLSARVAELVEAAASPEATERARAFLALARDKVDLRNST